ncbi:MULTISPECIES: ABC transporter ATP-binding protein [Microbacterium]|uniref:ABC transporter n=1 Tax=Microbacterium hominis TaxID=162426 RepID=A0A2K9DQ89_9MICO|nr:MULTISPECIES: ABC transporter ATP-binding protein [Microbacterium]AUG30558.1 ABC transporter [Microbacterium hominis]QOC26321.1 ABC transporter ATP-binding protein [Microbacterium hominis]QOC30265.1 ABC transporter ATP-binding protein [Microbacterium hominis]QYF97374.1 ABC transporter ATP-binding protein/permease [Microbacterium sp. PAMC21962]
MSSTGGTASVAGTTGEDRSDYTRAESRSIRQRSLRLLGSLVDPLRWQLVLALAVLVVSTALRVAGPALIAYGLNTALPQAMQDADWMPTIVIVAVYLLAGIGGAALIGWYAVVAARLTQAVMLDLRTRIFLHTQRLSLEFHESYTSGRIISRQTSDLDSIRELLDGGLNELVSGVLYGAFTLIALLLLDWQSGVILAVAGIPLYLLMRWFYRNSQRAYRESRVVSAKVIVKFVETMTGIRAVKAFRKEPRNDEEFGDLSGQYRDVNMRSLRLFGTFEPGMMAVSAFAVAGVLLWGGLRVVDGTLLVGTLLAAVLYVRNFFSPLQEVAMFLNSYQSATAALEKVSGVLEEEPTVPDPVRPVDLWKASGHVEFRDVVFGYADDRTILPHFSLDIPAGQTIALVGTTGAGKSTLAKLVSRFYDPSHGAVMLDGVDLRSLHPKDLRRAIVMVTQEAYLFSGTVADNIALGKPDATFEEIRAAARAVGADTFIERLPDGYDTDVNKRGGRVSAGQRQLISFARAFLADPAVLILDEATASLDIPSERQIQSALQTLLADRTAIIIAHRLSTVSIADRVLVMEHGRIIEDDTPAELIAGTGKFAQLHSAWKQSLV